MMIPIGTLGNYQDPGFEDPIEVRIIGHIAIGKLNLHVLRATEADELNTEFEPARPDLGMYFELLPEDDTEAFSLI